MVTLLALFGMSKMPEKDRPDLNKLGCFPVVLLLIDLCIVKVVCKAFGLDFDF